MSVEEVTHWGFIIIIEASQPIYICHSHWEEEKEIKVNVVKNRGIYIMSC